MKMGQKKEKRKQKPLDIDRMTVCVPPLTDQSTDNFPQSWFSISFRTETYLMKPGAYV